MESIGPGWTAGPFFLCAKGPVTPEFEEKLTDFIKANGFFQPGQKVLLAVSGGADSTALMHAMTRLRQEGAFNGSLACAHINHRLRKVEADADEQFVITEASRLGLTVTTRQINVRGFARRNRLSIETAARKLRIDNLLEVARENRCDAIATGHQKNDNAETVLHRLLRGTGMRGLGGIRPAQVFGDGFVFVRPLLCFTRDEICEYLRQQNIKWRTDRTNEDCRYKRNFIRHKLIPAIQQTCDSSLTEQLCELAESAGRFYSLLCRRADGAWLGTADCTASRIGLNLPRFLSEPEPVQVELARRSLTALKSGERDLTQRHYEMILQLARQNTGGRRVELPGGYLVRREYENLIFTSSGSVSTTEQNQAAELKVPGLTEFDDYAIETNTLEAGTGTLEEFRTNKDNHIEWFDLEKVKQPLFVRSRQRADRFQPLGMPAEKKLGKFLTSARVPQNVRKKTLVVTDSEKIIWVWPIRTGEQAKITDKTRRILQIQITRLVNGRW